MAKQCVSPMKTKQKEPCQSKAPMNVGQPTCRRDTPTPSIPDQAWLSRYILYHKSDPLSRANSYLHLKIFGKAPSPTPRLPTTPSNRRAAVGRSSSKPSAHMVYCLRVFRHGSPKQSGPILALPATAIGLVASSPGQRDPCRLTTLLLT